MEGIHEMFAEFSGADDYDSQATIEWWVRERRSASKEAARMWRASNKTKTREYKREWRRKRSESVREYQRNYQNEYRRKRMAVDPQYAEKIRQRARESMRKNYAAKRAARGLPSALDPRGRKRIEHRKAA